MDLRAGELDRVQVLTTNRRYQALACVLSGLRRAIVDRTAQRRKAPTCPAGTHAAVTPEPSPGSGSAGKSG